MRSLRGVFGGSRGFTLIEMILSICIASIVLASFYSIYSYSLTASNYIDLQDEILLNGRYAIEFIKEEISSADRIICSSKIKNLDSTYPDNIGFVIMKYENKEYNYSTYYLKNNELVRIARNKLTDTYPTCSDLQGYNQVTTMVVNIDKTFFNSYDNVINLYLDMGKDNKNMITFKSTIYIQCLTDF